MSLATEESGQLLSPMGQAIATHPFTTGMSVEHLRKLLSVAMFREFVRDEVVFREGDAANRFYLICQGKVILESAGRERPHKIQILGAGEAVGWSWLFPPYLWRFGARALVDTFTVFFYGTRLRQECEKDPAFGYELMQRVSAVAVERLQVLGEQLLRLQEAPLTNEPSI